MLAIYVALLTTVVAVANFTDFSIGKPGDKAVRAKLVDYYIAVNGDWKGLYQIPAALLVKYTRIVGGKNAWFYIRNIAFVSFLISEVALLLFELITAIRDHAAADFLVGSIFATAFSITNILTDLASWLLIFYVSHKLITANFPKAVALILVVAITMPLVLVSSMLMNFVISDLFVSKIFIIKFIPRHLIDGAKFCDSDYGCNSGQFPIILGALAILPITLFLIAMISGTILYLSRAVLGRPIAFILERLEAQEKSVLTSFALLFSIVLSLLAAWPKVFHA